MTSSYESSPSKESDFDFAETRWFAEVSGTAKKKKATLFLCGCCCEKLELNLTKNMLPENIIVTDPFADTYTPVPRVEASPVFKNITTKRSYPKFSSSFSQYPRLLCVSFCCYINTVLHN